jgi:hypothetical protein
MYGDDGLELTFENLIAKGLKDTIIKDVKSKVTGEKFAEFSSLTADTIVADIKLALMNFVSEEVVLTDKWGKNTFVGSIEDLIKQRFDDVLLRPVDNNGNRLEGCTSSGKTWIEWAIEQKLAEASSRIVKDAVARITKDVSASVDRRLIEFKDKAIKEEIDKKWGALIQQK